MRSLKQSRDRELSRMAAADRRVDRALLPWKALEHAHKSRRPMMARGEEVAAHLARLEARRGSPLPYSVVAGQGGVASLERGLV